MLCTSWGFLNLMKQRGVCQTFLGWGLQSFYILMQHTQEYISFWNKCIKTNILACWSVSWSLLFYLTWKIQWPSQVPQVVKNSPASARDARDVGLISGSGGSPEVGSGNALQYFLPGKFPGQRSLPVYSQWGHKELDTTEHAQAIRHKDIRVEIH